MGKQFISDETAKALWDRYVKGETTFILAKERGVSSVAISALFKRHKFKLAKRFCALSECGKEFQPLQTRQKYCCEQHGKRGDAYNRLQLIYTDLPCALPECNVMIPVGHRKNVKPALGVPTGSGRRFCCKDHGDLHSRRRKNGFYDRLLHRGPACEVCGERVIIDAHHEIFDRKTGSDLNGPVHYLCPTHHMAIHRGLAEYRNGRYVDLQSVICNGLWVKAAIYDNHGPDLIGFRFRGVRT